MGTVGDSCDDVLAEKANGFYEARLIRGPARWGRMGETVEDVELAALSWVHWHNHDRRQGYSDVLLSHGVREERFTVRPVR